MFLKDFLDVLVNLHVIALFIINVTRSPGKEFSVSNSYTSANRLYRLLEFLAGLITPLAKK